MFAGLVRSALAFSLSAGAAAVKANAEIFMRAALRQQSLVIHQYYDVFNRQRRIAASLEALRVARARSMMRSHAMRNAMTPPHIP